MTLSVDHIHHIDRHVINEGEDNKSMALWVPSERITTHRIDAPAAPQRKWSELIPWILEDRLLQPVDDMHFVIGAISSTEDKKQVDITVVSKQDMRKWLRIADNASVDPVALIPDYLALPSEEGRINMVWQEGVFLVRDDSGRGFSALPEVAWHFVRRLIETSDIEPRLSISVPDENLVPEDLRDDADINSADIDWPLSEIPLSANLLSGEFILSANKASSGAWLSTAALLILTVVLGFGYLQVSNSVLEQSVADLERQASKGFSNVFPGNKAKPEKVRASGESLLANLFKQHQNSNSPVMLALVGLDQFMAACNCDLESLAADESEIQLKLKNTGKLKMAKLKISGYKTTSRKLGEITSIRLLEVSKP